MRLYPVFECANSSVAVIAHAEERPVSIPFIDCTKLGIASAVSGSGVARLSPSLIPAIPLVRWIVVADPNIIVP